MHCQVRLISSEAATASRCFPDGRWVAFRSMRDGNSQIYKVQSDGTHLTRLTSNTFQDIPPGHRMVQLVSAKS